MEQTVSSYTDSRSACQEISLLLNPNVHYRVHKSPPVDPILNQMNSVHIVTPYFFKINFNIILILCS
jgi:hypothetical protein